MSDVVALESDAPRSPAPKLVARASGDARLVLCGIVLPIVTLCVELGNGMCAREFFDPLRTWVHVLGAALVPAIALVVAYGLPHAHVATRRLHAAAYAMLGANLYFAAYFAPLAPLGVVALLFVGLGLLPLAPLLALLSTQVVLRRLREADPRFPLRARIAWCVGAVVVLIGADPIGTWTRLRMAAAAQGGPVARAAAIDDLRRHSSEAVVRRVLDEGMRPPTDPIAYLLAREPDEGSTPVRAIVYQAFGVDIAEREPRRWFEDGDGFDGDASRRRGSWRDGFPSGRDCPRLAESSYDVRCDAIAATAETSWELVFSNPTGFPAEAVGTILLPAGAVVSGLTLWVDGKPREAAFATRTKAQRAYESIVAKRRDPALIVTEGVRRVRLSCFPIPARGTMRLRLAFIGALTVRSGGIAMIELPCFESGSFAHTSADTPPLRHRIEVRGGVGVVPVLAGLESSATDLVAGSVTHDELASHPVVARMDLVEPDRARLWTDPDGVTWSASVTRGAAAPSSGLVVVVDGSGPMARGAGWIADALERVEPTLDLAVVFAGDRAELLTSGGLAPALPARVREAAARLRSTVCIGGRDNAAALTLAVDLVRDRPDARILWVHAPQALALAGSDDLRIALELADEPPRIVSIATAARFDAVRTQLERARVDVDERIDANVGDALLLALREARSTDAQSRRVLGVADEESRRSGLALQRGGEVWTRLATYDRITHLLARGTAEAIGTAQTLSATARLVTPVSGAIVLETDDQYTDFGMEAPTGGGGEFSAAPEPETYAMIVLAAIVFAFVRTRRGGGA